MRYPPPRYITAVATVISRNPVNRPLAADRNTLGMEFHRRQDMGTSRIGIPEDNDAVSCRDLGTGVAYRGSLRTRSVAFGRNYMFASFSVAYIRPAPHASLDTVPLTFRTHATPTSAHTLIQHINAHRYEANANQKILFQTSLDGPDTAILHTADRHYGHDGIVVRLAQRIPQGIAFPWKIGIGCGSV